MRGEQRLTQSIERVEGKLVTQRFGQRAQNRPVFARIARREGRTARHLHAAFGIDVNRRLLRVGRARQHHVGAMGTAITMGADVDDETAGRHLDLVDAEQEQHVERAGFQHGGGIQAAIARNKPNIERSNERGFAVQDIEAVPAILDHAERRRGFCRHGQDGGTIRAIERTLPDDEHRLFSLHRRVVDKLRQSSPDRRQDNK